jgi:hypothetical protein
MIPKDVRTVSAEYETFIRDVMRDNQQRRLAQKIRKAQPRWYTRGVDWLLCELDHRRVVLAERLARYKLAQSVLRGEEMNLFSAGRCA